MDALRNLMQTLSKGEKKAISNMFDGSSSRHVQLYSALTLNDSITDDELIENLKTYKLDKRNFNVLKKYLFEQILKAIRSIRDKSLQPGLSNDLQNISILYHRGLFKEANKVLQSASKQAKDHELFLFQLQLLDWERLISINSSTSNYRTEEEIATEEAYIFHQQQELFRLKSINNTLEHLKKNVGTQPKNAAKLLLSKGVKEEEVFHLTPSSQKSIYYMHLNKLLFYFVNGDFEACGDESDLLIQVPSQFLTEEEILNAYLHRTTALSFVYRYEDTLKTFEALDQISKDFQLLKFKQSRNKIFYFRSTYQLSIYNKIKKESESHQLCKSILDQLEVEDLEQGQLNIVHYALSLTLLLIGENKKALQITNFILGQPVNKVRKDIYRWTLFVNIIAHYELDHSDLLSNLSRSYMAHFSQTRNTKAQFEVEITFLSAIRKLPDVHLNASKEVKKLYQKIQSISLGDTSELETGIKTLLDSWMESKFTSKSVLQAYQEKFY